MGGPWGKSNTDSEPGKARWLARGNTEEMPHMCDSNYHKCATLSLSPLVCLSTRTLFLPNKHFFLFYYFHLFAGIHFYKANGPGALSLATVPGGLAARIQRSHCHSLTSASGQGPKILLQATACWGHLRSMPSVAENYVPCVLLGPYRGGMPDRGKPSDHISGIASHENSQIHKIEQASNKLS